MIIKLIQLTFWIAFGGAAEFQRSCNKRFEETLQKEAPETWGRFSRPIPNHAYSSNASELRKYVRTMEYRALENGEITHAGNRLRISGMCSTVALVLLGESYLIPYLFHLK